MKHKLIVFDNCGGISFELLRDHVFRFGDRALLDKAPTLGVFGVGLKRSIFYCRRPDRPFHLLVAPRGRSDLLRF